MGGFLVLRPANRKDLSTRPPQYLLDELHRLSKLEAKSHQELVDYIEALPMPVPDVISDLLRKEAPSEQTALVSRSRAAMTTYKDAPPVLPCDEPMPRAPVILADGDSPRKRMRGKTTFSQGEAPIATENPPTQSELVASAAEMRASEAATRGIGDLSVASQMLSDSTAREKSGGEQFGERARKKLRRDLENSRALTASLLPNSATAAMSLAPRKRVDANRLHNSWRLHDHDHRAAAASRYSCEHATDDDCAGATLHSSHRRRNRCCGLGRRDLRLSVG